MTSRFSWLWREPLIGPRLMNTTPLPILIALMALFIVPSIILVQYIAWWRWDVVDDQMFAYFGWRIAHGGTVYLDVWDNKPPGIYWINALGMWLANDSYAGVIAMCVLALIVAHAAYFVICDTCFFRSAAALSTVVFCFFLTHIYYTGGSNRTETFLVPCELVAIAFYVRGFARPTWWKWFFAGLFCGAAFTFKQVGLAAFVAACLHLLITAATKDIRWGDWVKRQVLMLAGLATALLVVLALLYAGGGSKGIQEALFATFTFNRGYVATGNVKFPYNIATWRLLQDHVYPILLMPLLLAVGSILHASAWAASPQTQRADIVAQMSTKRGGCPRYMLLFCAWTLIAFYGAMLSPHAFRHYLVPTIPPLLLIGAHLLNFLVGEYTLFGAVQRSAWTTLAMVAIAFFCAEAVQRQWEEFSKVIVYRHIQGRRAEWEQVGDVVRHITDANDPIYCWGYFPGVYLDARRINACRFITTEKVGQVGVNARFVLDELEVCLRSNPPVALVISSQDYYWMHGLIPQLPSPSTEMGEWIDQNYTRVADLSLTTPVFVYKRNDMLRTSDFWLGYRPLSGAGEYTGHTRKSDDFAEPSGCALLPTSGTRIQRARGIGQVAMDQATDDLMR